MNGSPRFLRVCKGDLDGFFCLFVDNLLQLLLIFTLCPLLCGIGTAEGVAKILPVAAFSILVGNLYFSWQAWQIGGSLCPGLHIRGAIALSQGFLITSIIYAAVKALVIDHKFKPAAAWLLAAAAFSAIGLIHACRLTPGGVQNHFAWFWPLRLSKKPLSVTDAEPLCPHNSR